LEKIVITGNSGGGTASFYSACLDERIKISAPSCSFCTYDSSILDIHHCPCNQIPYKDCLIETRKWDFKGYGEEEVSAYTIDFVFEKFELLETQFVLTIEKK
jgi:hypothetical protein